MYNSVQLGYGFPRDVVSVQFGSVLFYFLLRSVLLCCAPLVKDGLSQTSFKSFIEKEESRRVAVFAMVEKGSIKMKRHRIFIGLPRGKNF